MAVPRYALLPSGTLFPFQTVTMERIMEEVTTIYQVVNAGNKVTIECHDDANPQGRTYTPIPARYEGLVRRFIYRGAVLARMLYCREGEEKLTEDIRAAIRANLMYHFHVLDFCRPAFREAAKQGGDHNVRFFDIYMVEDHYVGRHDPSAVILWQRDHPEINLRTQDVFALDWCYHRTRYGLDWEGKRIEWTIRNANIASLVTNARRIFGPWYELPYPCYETMAGEEEPVRIYPGDVLAELISDDEDGSEGNAGAEGKVE